MVAYDPTAWQREIPVADLEACYPGWEGDQAYRQVTVDALAAALARGEGNGKEPPHLLDVGCFLGLYFGRLLETHPELGRNWHYTGVDVTPAYIAEARKRWAVHAEMAHFEEGSVLQMLPRADIVHCSGVLIHLEDAASAITRLFQAARKRVFLGVSIDEGLTWADWSGNSDGPFIYRRYRLGYIRGLLQRYGSIIDETLTGDKMLWEVEL